MKKIKKTFNQVLGHYIAIKNCLITGTQILISGSIEGFSYKRNLFFFCFFRGFRKILNLKYVKKKSRTEENYNIFLWHSQIVLTSKYDILFVEFYGFF